MEVLHLPLLAAESSRSVVYRPHTTLRTPMPHVATILSSIDDESCISINNLTTIDWHDTVISQLTISLTVTIPTVETRREAILLILIRRHFQISALTILLLYWQYSGIYYSTYQLVLERRHLVAYPCIDISTYITRSTSFLPRHKYRLFEHATVLRTAPVVRA